MLALCPHDCERPAPLPCHGSKSFTRAPTGRLDHSRAALAGKWELHIKLLRAVIAQKEAKSSAKGGFCLFCGPGQHHNDAPRSYHLKVTGLVQRNILQFLQDTQKPTHCHRAFQGGVTVLEYHEIAVLRSSRFRPG